MIQEFDGKRPVIHPTVFVHETAVIIGDVAIGEGSSVWPNAVIRADFAPIRIGRNTHIEDCSVVHTGSPLEIGDNVTLGHGVVAHCRRIGSNVLIGNNATVLDDAEIGDFCIVAAGAVVTPRTVVPPYSMVMGVPGQITPLTEEQAARLRRRGNSDGGYAAKIRRYREQGIGVPPLEGTAP
jgi:carbonic anhydrase/acetyltransferase-like protein (isoleucine patch superfamily)